MTYRITWQISADPHALRVALTSLPSASPVDPVIVAPLVKFAELGAHGGLSGRQYDPALAQVVVQSSVVRSRTQAECQFSLRNISPDAVQMLTGAIAYIDAKIAPLANVLVECPRSMIQANTEPGSGYYRPVPFTVVDERTFQSRGFELQLEFVNPIPEILMEQVEYEAYGYWVSAVNVGCFASPALPAEVCAAIPAGDPIIADRSMILALEEAVVTETDASDSLINVLQWVHAHIAPLSRVELYE